MKSTMSRTITTFERRALFTLAWAVFAAAATYSQGTGGPGGNAGSCTVTQLRLRFATSNDDLRGGQDNLNIVVYFTSGGYQFAPNVNHSQNWPNNSVNMVEIPLNRPVPPGEIRALRLVHIADGGFNIHNLPELATPAAPIAIAQAFQSPDNWNMADVEVSALGNGVGARIATSGFHRFTGSNPDLIIGTHIPPNICSSGRPTGSSGGQGEVSGGGSGSGSGELLSPGNEKGMVAAQPASSALVERNRVANAKTPSVGSNSGLGGTSEKQVTNADVFNMLSAGISEETILSTIRTRPANFDVSTQARATFDRECAKIKHPGQTTTAWAAEVKNIWEVMANVMIARQTNGRGGEGEDPAGGATSSSSGANPTSNPITPRGSSPASGSGLPKPLTIDDVVKMLQAGLPEQSILASIRSSSADFNLSNKEKANEAKTRFFRELRKTPTGTPASAWSNELNDIWEAIAGKAAEGAGTPAATPGTGGSSAGNKNADELSPQPYPPKGGNSAASAAGKQLGPPSRLLKTKLGPAKKGPTIANAAAASHKAAILATLQSQKNAADAVATQMKTALRMAGQPGISQGPSRTMSASGSSGSAQANGRTAANAQVGATSSSNASQNSGLAAPRLSQIMGPAESQTLMCAQDPTERILQVSGTDGPITFTTDPAGNFYTITGCSFGTAGPNAKAYIYLGNSFHQEFQIQEWNDLYIKCNLDPSLTNVGDQDNLTLVVQRYDGKQAVKTGFKFYAMRETRRLAVFPQQYFSLSKFNVQNVSDLVGGIQSPVDPAGSFPNNTAEGYWYDPDLQPVQNKGFVTAKSTPPSGTDIYDFSHLVLGFEVTSASLSWPDPSAFCSAAEGSLVASSGAFGGQWNGSQLWITWQGWNCNWNKQNCNIFGCTDVFEAPITDYGLDVIVEGPRGVDPWTGQPVSH